MTRASPLHTVTPSVLPLLEEGRTMHTIHQDADKTPPPYWDMPLPEDWDPGALPRPDWEVINRWEARLGLLP